MSKNYDNIFEQFSNSLVDDNELKTTLSRKNKDYIERTIEQELKQKYFGEGWELVKDNKTTSRIKKIKSHDVLFEDKVWSILARMGFETLNADSNLKLPYLKDNTIPGRQIDVFAADSETILVVECKSSMEMQKKSLQTIINDFETIKRGSLSFLKEFFGNNRKVKFILATHNIIINDNDRKRLIDLQIEHFNQDDISYYEQLTSYLGQAAKYQLLGRLFKNQEIPELKNKVPAIKGKMGKHTFFSFSLEPDTLLKISYILHNTVTTEESDGAYQRMVSKTRLKEIEHFLNNEGYFPNSIIINVVTPKENPLYFDNVKGIHDSTISDLCILHLPKCYQSAFIIDGQHRLYGYSNTEWKFKNSIPVVAFENLPIDEQVKMFVDINHKQRSVSKNLLTTIMADLKWGSSIYNEALFAVQSKLLQRLGERDESPLYRRVIVGENKKSDLACITLDYIISYGFNKSNFFARVNKNKLISTGPLWVDDYSLMLTKAYEYFTIVLDYVKTETIDNWQRGSNEGGFISMNVGIMAIIRICDSILAHLIQNEELEAQLTSSQELAQLTIKYITPITDLVKTISGQKARDFRNAGTGGVGRENVVREFQKTINLRFSNFDPAGLKDWIRDNSGIYNQESKVFVDNIQLSIRDYLFDELKNQFGERWWYDGVPKETQKRSAAEAIERGNNEPHWHFVYLLDYLKIITSNWPIFKDAFSDPNKEVYQGTTYGSSQKEKATHWFSKLNDIRTKVSHPERAAVTESEYKFLEQLNTWLMPNITQQAEKESVFIDESYEEED
ncbi:DGQHR domain-containing protein [Flavobacterium paronense]|uniref:DGQHR domain-containing protein n=1 Tax=Flavobacterium paronense TaxID=1392775 RepID=A0ABV5GGX2_9FLAO|nr:DGQHR domain-containing protein [Flavobacterium paronense]MDN3677238.1 DGQHR domain-containing protein [Flavobacterium paronense]